MIDEIKKQVSQLLDNDNSGHGMEHINRVLKLSLKFAKSENANIEIVSLIALLHDVDDYKLFGTENAENLTNAKRIMDNAKIDEEKQDKVLSAIKCIGYGKALKGIRPQSLEGKIVSDADMCDASGISGILRTHKYTIKNGKPFFNRNIFPIENITAEKYNSRCADTCVCHMFEKMLKLKDLMLTNSGRVEAVSRHQIMVDLLYHLFDEENAPEWTEYLNRYLNK